MGARQKVVNVGAFFDREHRPMPMGGMGNAKTDKTGNEIIFGCRHGRSSICCVMIYKSFRPLINICSRLREKNIDDPSISRSGAGVLMPEPRPICACIAGDFAYYRRRKPAWGSGALPTNRRLSWMRA